MTSEQGFVYVTRALCLFCLISALVALSYLPQTLLEAVHHWQTANAARAEDVAVRTIAPEVYFFRIYLLHSAAIILQVVGYFWAAGWLYRGGPKLRRFFGLD